MMSVQNSFSDKIIDSAVFDNCSMVRARFDDVNVSESVFSNVNLQRAHFTNVNLEGVSIQDANISGLTIFGHDIQSLINEREATLARTASGVDTVPAMTAEPQLFVSDMDTACRFYLQQMGFRVVLSHGTPPYFLQISRGSWRVNLRSVCGPVFDAGFRVREADALSATLTLDDAKAIFEEFQAAGITMHQALRAESWGALTFIVKDPDGNLIAFAGRIR